MSLFKKTPKLCRNCIYFETTQEMWGQTQGLCNEVTITSRAFAADFISSPNHDPVKVWWNFGCVRFKKKDK